MTVTHRKIAHAFSRAEDDFEFCWKVLVGMKDLSTKNDDFINGFITFQDKLATSIFNLQSIRDKILIEEKETVKNKKKYSHSWFLAKVKRLSKFKEGIDSAVNIAKALGDAYAHFFYQNDVELLSDHYTHQRVINHTAGIGELGELQFLKKIKHIEGHFTLFHGITNTLRHGDFSFIDLKTLRVTQIGELKTKKISDNTLELSISLIKRKLPTKAAKKLITDPELEKQRQGRQILGIANLLSGYIDPGSLDKSLVNKSHVEPLRKLLKNTKSNSSMLAQVSAGLLFSCIKLRKTSLYHRIFLRDSSKAIEKSTQQLTDAVVKLIKPSSNRNGVILGQLLYNPDYSDKNTPGTTPLFWHNIDVQSLKGLYFSDSIILSFFNPAHLIEDIENMGFWVETKYSDKKNKLHGPSMGTIQRFDLFISYIVNYLMTEDFVLDSIVEIKKSEFWGNTRKILIRPQQKIDILGKMSKPFNKP